MFFLGVWALFFIESLVSYESCLYLGVFFMLFRYFFKSRASLTFRQTCILLCAPVAGFLLHFLQNAWFFGSIPVAFWDLVRLVMERASHRPDVLGKVAFADWFNLVVVRNFSLALVLPWGTLLCGAVALLFLSRRLPPEHREALRRLMLLGALFFLCGISWYIAAPLHSFAHAYVYFLVRHVVPFAAVSLSIFFYGAFIYLRGRKRPERLLVLSIVLFMVFVYVDDGVEKKMLPFSAKARASAADFRQFSLCLFHAGRLTQENETIGTNYFRYPPMTYYSNRNYQVIDKGVLMADGAVLPKYFMFVPDYTVETGRLLRFLRQKYTPLLRCQSKYPTGIFFELNG